MLVGVFLRNIKVYKGQHYIPLSDGQRFSALIGPNGAGKSSVLEAIDLVLNDRDAASWNINKSSSASTKTANFPFVTLVLLVHKDQVSNETFVDLSRMSGLIWEYDEPALKSAIPTFLEHRERLARRFKNEDWVLVLLGKRYGDGRNFYLASFHNYITKSLCPQSLNDEEAEIALQQTIKQSLSDLIDIHEYFYIPVETDPRVYTKLETVDMQRLMGRSIEQKINEAIGDSALGNINVALDEFVSGLARTMESYEYKNPGRKQSLTKRDLVTKVLEAYFSVKTLHKKQGTKPLPVSELSSGQKRRALVDVAYSFLCAEDRPRREVILAVDEPDASLDRDSCFEQFEKLFSVSEFDHQVLTATHWYGFLPIVHNGTALSLGFDSDENLRPIDSFDLYSYPENMRILAKKTRSEFPHDVALKSHNDLVQSITSSVLKQEDGYRWVICEGTSDKIYLELYLAIQLKGLKFRVIPVAGRDEVRRLFDFLSLTLKDRVNKASGRILCLVDTDSTSIKVEATNLDKVIDFRRLIRKSGAIQLVGPKSNEVSPETAVEDCLPCTDFVETIKKFRGEFECVEAAIKAAETEPQVTISGALDMRESERKLLKESFFGAIDKDMKVVFARAFCEVVKSKTKQPEIPDWLTQIADYLKAGKKFKG